MIKIANAHTYAGQGVYVGRQMPGREGSVLANQFKIGLDGTREQCIEKYRVWLRRMYKAGKLHRADGLSDSGPMRVLVEIERLAAMHKAGQDIVLICWCRPQACHAEVIKQAIEGIASHI